MLIIVIVELAFAFGVGVGCILFSFNLFRSIYSSGDSAEVDPGAFPRARSHHALERATSTSLEESLFECNAFHDTQGISETSLMSPSGSFDRGRELEMPQSVFGIMKTFTDYMHLY